LIPKPYQTLLESSSSDTYLYGVGTLTGKTQLFFSDIYDKICLVKKLSLFFYQTAIKPGRRRDTLNDPFPHNNQLAREIDKDWANLEACLEGLSELQIAQICDAGGWRIQDHLAHIATWEEILLLLFVGIPMEDTMRIPWGKFPLFDDVNQDLCRQWADFSADWILRRLRRVHDLTMAKISSLSEEDLLQPAVRFFPYIRDYEKRNVADFIRAHTNIHYRDHTALVHKLTATSPSDAGL